MSLSVSDLPEAELRRGLCDAVTFLHTRGWCPGTGGNFSARLSTDPPRLVMSPSGVDKGTLTPESLIVVDAAGRRVEGEGSPSAETLLHLAIIEERGAGSVLHTHSIWNTLLSERLAKQGVVAITGYEMLKGLAGVRTHEHTERVPILQNSQDMPPLAEQVRRILRDAPACHGFLLAGHGLYTWGSDITEARRHVEIFEFLFELTGRKLFAGLA